LPLPRRVGVAGAPAAREALCRVLQGAGFEAVSAGPDGLSALADVACAVEAMPGEPLARTALARALDAALPAGAALVLSTPGTEVGPVSTATRRPGEVVGLVLPLPGSALLERVAGHLTREPTLQLAADLADALARPWVDAPDTPGGVSRRLALAGAAEAARAGLTPAALDALATARWGVARGPGSIWAGLCEDERRRASDAISIEHGGLYEWPDGPEFDPDDPLAAVQDALLAAAAGLAEEGVSGFALRRAARVGLGLPDSPVAWLDGDLEDQLADLLGRFPELMVEPIPPASGFVTRRADRLRLRLDRATDWIEPVVRAELQAALVAPGIGRVESDGPGFGPPADRAWLQAARTSPDAVEELAGAVDALADHDATAWLRGPASGPALALALACRQRIATAEATLGLPELALGALPLLGTLTLAADAAPSLVANDPLPAEHAVGLIDAVRPPCSLDGPGGSSPTPTPREPAPGLAASAAADLAATLPALPRADAMAWEREEAAAMLAGPAARASAH